MNWSDLPMSQRSELMSIYLKNGITSLDEMKKHYNSFAEGGNIDDPPSSKQSTDTVSGADQHPYNSKLDRAQRSWLQHWYDNRSSQLEKNLKDYNWGSEASKIGSFFTSTDRYRNNMFNYADNVPIIDRRVLNAQEAANVAESLKVLPTIENYQYNKYNERGFYTAPYKQNPVIGITPNADETTSLHEFVHAMQDAGRYKSFYPYGAQIGAINNNLDRTKYRDRYLDKPEEIYSRLMQIRYSNKINPKHKWNKSEIQEFKKNAKDFNLLNRYDDDFLLYLFNEVADAGQSSIGNYAAKGGKLDIPPYTQFLNTLPDNLKNSGDEYNMRRYWELNNYPKDFNEGIQLGMFAKQDDGYHANSVAFNPITNSYEFMKDRNHPTYNMELDWYYSDDPEAVEFRKKYKYTPGIGMIPDQYTPIYRDGGKIHIKPENRGKFTALKKRTGHSASWFKENGTPAQKKMAVFELNSKKWRK